MNEIQQLRNFDVDKDGHAASLEAAHAITEFSPPIVPPMGVVEQGASHTEPRESLQHPDHEPESLPRTMKMGTEDVLNSDENRRDTEVADKHVEFSKAEEKENTGRERDASEGGDLPPGGTGKPPTGGGSERSGGDESSRYTPEQALSLATALAARLRKEQERDLAIRDAVIDPSGEKQQESTNPNQASFEMIEDMGRAYIIQRHLLHPGKEVDLTELVNTSFSDDFINRTSFKMAEERGKPLSDAAQQIVIGPEHDGFRTQLRGMIALELQANQARVEQNIREAEQLIPVCEAMADPENGITVERILESDDGYIDAMRRAFTPESFVAGRSHLLDPSIVENAALTDMVNALIMNKKAQGDLRDEEILRAEALKGMQEVRKRLGITQEEWQRDSEGGSRIILRADRIVITEKIRQIWGSEALDELPESLKVVLDYSFEKEAARIAEEDQIKAKASQAKIKLAETISDEEQYQRAVAGLRRIAEATPEDIATIRSLRYLNQFYSTFGQDLFTIGVAHHTARDKRRYNSSDTGEGSEVLALHTPSTGQRYEVHLKIDTGGEGRIVWCNAEDFVEPQTNEPGTMSVRTSVPLIKMRNLPLTGTFGDPSSELRPYIEMPNATHVGRGLYASEAQIFDPLESKDDPVALQEFAIHLQYFVRRFGGLLFQTQRVIKSE